MPNVELPPSTQFAIDPSDSNMRIRCLLENVETGGSTELSGDQCPTRPSQGLHGAQFAPKAGYWTIRPGQAITIIFPIFSTDELKGIAGTPADCLIVSIWAAGAENVWDTPQPTDQCPLPKGRGVWQGVFVAFNPPTVGYPTPSATSVTATSARTSAYLFSHFDPGSAFAELGTDTSYGMTSRLAIPGTSDSFTVDTDWTGLEPDTLYHWRLRFVDAKGRTFTGPDQTFRTKAAPRDTVAPTVTRIEPAANAKAVGPKADISVDFSEGMRPITINAKTIKLFKKGEKAAVKATVTYDDRSSTATLYPLAKLEAGATYRAEVGTDVQDIAGNGLDRAKTWSFTVKG